MDNFTFIEKLTAAVLLTGAGIFGLLTLVILCQCLLNGLKKLISKYE